MNNEQTVRVGIMSANEIHVVFHSTYLLDGKPFIGEFTFGCPDRPMLFQPADAEGCFTLRGVTIGIGFHWQRQEDQKFRGSLLLLSDGGKAVAIDVVPVETYLTSVISSEMSASASLELLKAHAVISRSWLLAMINKSCSRTQPSDAGRQPSRHEQLNPDSVIRWYDSEAHQIFDVCADDHCQRYQGISRQTNQHVVEAISQTRGQVLTYRGELCDARFSKCCGGMTEVFETCWEPVSHPYLVTKPCPYCHTNDRRILFQVLNSYDQETNDFYRWTVSYTMSQLSDLVRRKSGIDFGLIRDLIPMERSEAGRIIRLKIVGDRRTVTVGKELEIRKWLSESHLYSSAFDVEHTADGIVLHGRGWGHGVGLCQIGAAVMGDQGIPYEDILQFYYPGTQLTLMW